MSREVDVLPIAKSNEETAMLADKIYGVAGEFSLFEDLHGFSIDGVDLETAALPEGWRARLVRVQNENTASPDRTEYFVGWCLDVPDACAAKLCAHREKDLLFVGSLLSAGLVDAAVIRERMQSLPSKHEAAAERGFSGWHPGSH